MSNIVIQCSCRLGLISSFRRIYVIGFISCKQGIWPLVIFSQAILRVKGPSLGAYTVRCEIPGFRRGMNWTLGWEFPGSLSAGYRRKGCSVCGQAHIDRVRAPILGQAFPHQGHLSWLRPGKVNPSRRKEETEEVTSNPNPQTTSKYWTNNLKEDVVFYCAQPKHKSKTIMIFLLRYSWFTLLCVYCTVKWYSVCIFFSIMAY